MSELRPLTHLRVLVTRPQQRADNFTALVEHAGGEAVTFPVIAIADTDLSGFPQAFFDTCQMAIFISPTAVEKTFAHISQLPEHTAPVAIGSRTAEKLKQYGYSASTVANSHDSEGLLADPAMQAESVSGQRIIIFRGEGGRNLLADVLRERGAQVEYANMYARVLPDATHLQTAQLEQLQAICVTSNQGLEHLLLLCDDHETLKSLPLFVPGQRAVDLATRLGFSAIYPADNASDDAMLRALILWGKTKPGL